MKATVFVDMDGVLADFDKAIGNTQHVWVEDPPQMFERGFFRNLEVVPGAKEAITKLWQIPNLDIYIATKPTTRNLWCATEKYQWVEEHFPELLRKMFLTCDKSLLKGDFLIDDDQKWRGFDGHFLLFKTVRAEQNWKEIVELFEGYYGGK